ncbi:hypothetical protein GPJ56_008401 [Histomonas meleagridis]|uniref:uncharacterized protein n=1 Tax=Histomonas meleagridis TaxID=135588 RepID=UPI00355A25E1|nr:hypothetical protein GPJ56_008401 [Histomonas meleagridis]KAH0805498.1 hypothetical protein GO595_001553 [Histomonas meleagridis]
MSLKANNTQLSAIFRVIRCFLEYPSLENGVELFSPIVPIAAKSVLNEASLLLESFVNISIKSTTIPIEGWETRFMMEKYEPEWSSVSQELQNVLKEHDKIIMPIGDTDLNEIVFIVPMSNDMWKQPHVEIVRKELSNVMVQPYTNMYQNMMKISNNGKARKNEEELYENLRIMNTKEYQNDEEEDYVEEMQT